MMNTRNLLIASLIGGVISTALSNIPVINLVNCLVCAGFWVGPLFAVWFYKRQSGTITLSQGIITGILAGVVAGVLGFLLSLLGRAGIEPLIRSYSRFMPPDAKFELPPPGLASIMFNFVGVIVNIVFGAIGGLIGGLIFKPKTAPVSEI
jgi:hypothetical protein